MTPPPSVLKIVSHFHPFRGGGAEIQALKIARGLAGRGGRVTVLTLHRDDSPDEEDFEGVRILRKLRPLALGPLWGLTYHRQVTRWMRRLRDRYELVHCQQVYIHTAAAARLRASLGKPVVGTVVCGGEYGDFVRLAGVRFGGWYLNQALQADRMIALSRDLVGEIERTGYPADRIAHIPNMVDTERFAPPEQPRNEDELLFVGRLAAQKNLSALLEAFEIARRSRPALVLTLVGEGPDEPALRRRAEELGVRDAVNFEGLQADVAPYLRRAALSVTTSTSEGLSNALQEAMSCGIPIVALGAAGNAELIEPDEIGPEGFAVGKHGLLVGRPDPSATAAAIVHALERPDLRREMERRARATCLERYTPDRILDRIVALYRDALGSG